MSDIENMTDREIIMGLMRGDRATMKQGYGARSAVLTVESLRYKDRPDEWDYVEKDLQMFAEGYAFGINENSAELQPVSVDTL